MKNEYPPTREEELRSWGGMINAGLLLCVGIYLMLKGIDRIDHPVVVDSFWMTAIAFAGGAMNLVQHKLLHGDGPEISRYWKIFFVGFIVFAVEISGGIITGSLSLAGDAWHVLADNGAITVSIAVAYLAGEKGRDKNHVTHSAMNAHIVTDFLQSLAVVAGGVYMYFTNMWETDGYLSIAVATVLIAWSVVIFHQSIWGEFGKDEAL